MSEQTSLTNIPEFSVSELAFSVKRTVEETFGRVRVRGELSRVSIPKSGHMYSSLKDDKSVIDAVCWKGMLSRLSIRPEEGLEVICTGKMTTYPGSSKYQLVIESMELAGEGALLKMLEARKKKLAAEGIFDPERKQPLPFLPERIGVVTSPTGAVIRDILHRLDDRFPRHVLLWPVKVQGEGAAEEITKAIDGFNQLPETHRPDIIIVARGGGSLEDLMAFNEENVVRATANSKIPLISAVGHETDTTLIDYAADARAPTPTGAAEIAVPVRLNLMAQVADDGQRLFSATTRMIRDNRQRIENAAARLGSPERLLELKVQNLDRASERVDSALKSLIINKRESFTKIGAKLSHPRQNITAKEQKLNLIANKCDTAFNNIMTARKNRLLVQASNLKAPSNALKNAQRDTKQTGEKLNRAITQVLKDQHSKLQRHTEKLELLSFENVLQRGFVVIRNEQGTPIAKPDALNENQNVILQFKDNQKLGARITDKKAQAKEKPATAVTSEKKKSSPVKTETQGNLF